MAIQNDAAGVTTRRDGPRIDYDGVVREGLGMRSFYVKDALAFCIKTIKKCDFGDVEILLKFYQK